MKILMLVSYPEIGGTETHVLFLAKALQRYGMEIGVATRGGPFVPHFRRSGIPVYKLYNRGQAASSGEDFSVLSIVRDNGYDVIHAHDTESFRMLSALRRHLPSVPFVMTVHGTYYSRTEVLRAASVANRVITVSPHVRRWVLQMGVPAIKVQPIANGIDIQEFSPRVNPANYRGLLRLPAQAKTVLYVGRFQSDKWGIARKLILAGERVARKNNNFVVVLIGPGAYRNRLKSLANQVNGRLGKSVIYVLPPTTRIASYYHAATIVVGTGRVALEAMACGKPVIASGRAGYQGIVTAKSMSKNIDNHFGDHAAPTRMTIGRLENDIQRLLSNPTMAKVLGSQGRKVIVERFSIGRAAELTSSMYAGLLQS